MVSMIKFLRWFFSPSSKTLIEEHAVYEKLMELEEKYNSLSDAVRRLEEENIETTNSLYEVLNETDIDKHFEYNLKDFTLGE